jgi:hypothetical protein
VMIFAPLRPGLPPRVNPPEDRTIEPLPQGTRWPGDTRDFACQPKVGFRRMYSGPCHRFATVRSTSRASPAGRLADHPGDAGPEPGGHGESPTLSHEEHERVIDVVMRRRRPGQGHAGRGRTRSRRRSG